jgi:hypothetical protein
MSCCGQQRLQLLRSKAAARPKPAAAPITAQSSTSIVFEYIGATGLTALGPSTGVRYRFNRPGARVAVDARDAQGLSAVPVLRRVPGGAHTT